MDGRNLKLVCNIHLHCIFFFYGLPDIVDDVRFDKDEIWSKPTNLGGFLTFSCAFILFVGGGGGIFRTA